MFPNTLCWSRNERSKGPPSCKVTLPPCSNCFSPKVTSSALSTVSFPFRIFNSAEPNVAVGTKTMFKIVGTKKETRMCDVTNLLDQNLFDPDHPKIWICDTLGVLSNSSHLFERDAIFNMDTLAFVTKSFDCLQTILKKKNVIETYLLTNWEFVSHFVSPQQAGY